MRSEQLDDTEKAFLTMIVVVWPLFCIIVLFIIDKLQKYIDSFQMNKIIKEIISFITLLIIVSLIVFSMLTQNIFVFLTSGMLLIAWSVFNTSLKLPTVKN